MDQNLNIIDKLQLLYSMNSANLELLEQILKEFNVEPTKVSASYGKSFVGHSGASYARNVVPTTQKEPHLCHFCRGKIDFNENEVTEVNNSTGKTEIFYYHEVCSPLYRQEFMQRNQR